MKMFLFSCKMPDKQRKIEINKRCRLATAGAESTLILLNAPLMDALSLQMEQVGDQKELSW